MRPMPDSLPSRPFTRSEALALGVTKKMLEGRRFVRIYPRVFRSADHEMTTDDWVTAARLALPDTAQLTGISRLQALGLDYGPRLPVRLVIEGELHLAFENVFLHRTKRLPPTDHVGVTVEAAYVSYCSRARVIDAIKVGDWLLRSNNATIESIRTFALSCLWRDGADEAIWILDHLDGRSRSLMESEMRAILTFAGLPRPEINVAVDVGEDVEVISDVVYRRWSTVVEYEGSQHQEDRAVYNADIDRYGLIRDSEHRYVQVTKERIRQPRIMVGMVYRALLRGGYDGPPPGFGVRWQLLFRSVSVAVGPRKDRERRPAVG
ncbi:hypothetical protein [Nocardioides sp. YIM 152315]|uniref:hypothetical protein n=1 Tax=Nocardioides sp. YIM 152315 TaxID=3031760 RepID=UPI0023DBB59F|nr:hypothetical protein [Nocardioides sp. YIM 152315]MDF1604349.1 hypothetical protein [Nocardioides sp. YIM 152315]